VANKRKGPKNAAARSEGVKRAAAKAETATGASAAGFELGELRQLIRLVQRTGIGELEVSSGGRSVRISATSSSAQGQWVAAPAAAPARPAGEAPAAAAVPAGAAAAAASDKLKAITSPMVGTFYRAPAPDADPFVESGDVIEAGQTVCIIEAMKLMNEIEAEFKGRVVQILVENAQPVEFGQKLFLVEPA
jgi:acetyl-CoA carboxylase biotin carboxyl carrier protein